jgi:hypothetical protein
MVFRSQVICSCIPLLVCTLIACGQKTAPPAAPPVIYSVPSAITPGSSVAVTWYGDSLAKPLGLWTSFPADVTAPPADGAQNGQATFRIKIASNVSVGLGAVRLMTTAGASNLRLLLIDDLPTVLQKGGNNTREKAQAVSAPVAIDGASEPASSDYYSITGKKGQRLSAEIFAQRIGSRMDAMMRLLDSSGRELMYCDDSPGAGSDPRFSFTFAADGNHILEIRDVNYEGGPEYRYRLRLGDFPIATCAFPLAAKRGSAAKFVLEGAGCEGLPPLAITLPDAPRAWLGAKRSGGKGSAIVPVLCPDNDEIVEAEPNDTPLRATKIAIPGGVSAHFQAPGDIDYFQFHAAGGSKIAIRSFARDIGSAANVSLQILAADGTLIAESKVAGPQEASVEAAIPSDGIYLVRASELSGAGGPGMYYRLELGPIRPGFLLSTDTEVLNAAPGGSVKLKVTAVRRDYNGQISLSLVGEHEGIELANSLIAEGKTEAELEVRVKSDQPPGRLIHLGIVGNATVDGRQISQKLSTMPALQKLFPRMAAPPLELDGMIGLDVVGK